MTSTASLTWRFTLNSGWALKISVVGVVSLSQATPCVETWPSLPPLQLIVFIISCSLFSRCYQIALFSTFPTCIQLKMTSVATSCETLANCVAWAVFDREQIFGANARCWPGSDVPNAMLCIDSELVSIQTLLLITHSFNPGSFQDTCEWRPLPSFCFTLALGGWSGGGSDGGWDLVRSDFIYRFSQS